MTRDWLKMLLTKISVFWTFVLFVYGLLFGSFANVIAYRVPRRESILYPSSRCPNCSYRLSMTDLIPVLSWLALRGRCKSCKTPILQMYPVVELSLGVLWVLTLWQSNSLAQLIVWAVFWFFLLIVVGTDLTSMRVPNCLSLPAFIFFFAASVLSEIQTWQSAAEGALAGFCTLYIVHQLSKGKMGLGDVKLYLVIGTMLGPWSTIVSFILACGCGTCIGAFLFIRGSLQRGQPMPFVPYIAMGVILSAFFGQKLVFWYIETILHLSY